MKIAIRTVCFHFLCILIFGIIYYNIQYQFQHKDEQRRKSILDYILLSTTIQASVGITDIFPTSARAQLLMIVQQLIMIMANVFTVYVFTL